MDTGYVGLVGMEHKVEYANARVEACMHVRMFAYRYVRTLDLGPITTFKCGLRIRAPHVYSTTGGDVHGDF